MISNNAYLIGTLLAIIIFLSIYLTYILHVLKTEREENERRWKQRQRQKRAFELMEHGVPVVGNIHPKISPEENKIWRDLSMYNKHKINTQGGVTIPGGDKISHLTSHSVRYVHREKEPNLFNKISQDLNEAMKLAAPTLTEIRDWGRDYGRGVNPGLKEKEWRRDHMYDHTPDVCPGSQDKDRVSADLYKTLPEELVNLGRKTHTTIDDDKEKTELHSFGCIKKPIS